MSIERVKEYFRPLGREGDILEFPVSSATVELAAQAVSGDPELALSMMKYLARTVRLLSEQLDAMAPGHPLVIHHKSGHMGLMNSAALSALGITPETPVPPGGKIGVKDRCLTGYLEEIAFFTYL